MKIIALLLLSIFLYLATQAQTGPKLYALLTDSYHYKGSLIQYIGGDTIATIECDSLGFPWGNISLTEANNGKFYAITMAYGGSIVEYDRISHTGNILGYSLSYTSAGAEFWGPLLSASDGKLYGMAQQGGLNNGGTIFSYTIGDSFANKLIDLAIDARPTGSLIQTSDSILYGLTSFDGVNSSGTIFRFNLSTVTYQTVFHLPKYAHPFGSLIRGGGDTLYGLTSYDGLGNNFPGGGTIFEYIPSTNTYNVLNRLPVKAHPMGSLIRASNGLFYGLTDSDGVYYLGTIFSFDRNTKTYRVLHDFGAFQDGANPMGDLYQASDGILYGVTDGGGDTTGQRFANGNGTIFQYDITSSTYTKKVNLNSRSGSEPRMGHLVEYKGPSGIANIEKYNFTLYPNPSSGVFTIEHNYSDKIRIHVIDMLGAKLKEYNFQGNKKHIDISDLAAGLYQIVISDKSQTLKVFKVVKQ